MSSVCGAVTRVPGGSGVLLWMLPLVVSMGRDRPSGVGEGVVALLVPVLMTICVCVGVCVCAGVCVYKSVCV